MARQLRAKKFKARTVTLKVKHADFRMVTRRTTLERPTQSGMALFRAARDLFRNYPLKSDLRPIGVGASGLLPVETPVQQDLFGGVPAAGESRPAGSDVKWEKADRVVDDIDRKFGKGAVKKGTLVDKEDS